MHLCDTILVVLQRSGNTSKVIVAISDLAFQLLPVKPMSW